MKYYHTIIVKHSAYYIDKEIAKKQKEGFIKCGPLSVSYDVQRNQTHCFQPMHIEITEKQNNLLVEN